MILNYEMSDDLKWQNGSTRAKDLSSNKGLYHNHIFFTDNYEFVKKIVQTAASNADSVESH